MTSILTNNSAMAALQTLRAVASSLGETQQRVSTGLRVGTATDNAAYWSISTTMRSDNMALAAVSDALGLGAAKVDTAYAGMEAVVDLLAQFKARLVAATEAGVDKAKIQEELEQFKEQVVGIAQSASFSGENWLNTEIADIYDKDINKASVVSSFVRDASGHVSVKRMQVHLSEIALFNSNDGGLLQKDARDIQKIGGMRYLASSASGSVWRPEFNTARNGQFTFTFTGPIVFDDPADEIRFDVTVDADNPADGIPGPYNPGFTSDDIVINRAVLDAFRPTWNGIISSYSRYREVLDHVLQGTGASAHIYNDYYGNPIIDRIWIETDEDRSLGLDGSYVEISNLASNVSTGGLSAAADFGGRGSGMTLYFDPFQVYEDGENEDGIEVSFNFSVNGAAPTTHSFNRTYVNTLLGKDTGKVETTDEMVVLLESLLLPDWPGVIVEATPSGYVVVKSDETLDRLSGSSTRISFSNIVVSNEPLPTENFLEIDIVSNPAKVESYIDYIEAATTRVISGAAVLGSLQQRIAMQSGFTEKLIANIDKGIGRLVDADMNEESSRLKALQTQEQLAMQSLSIANSNAETVMQLFQ
nr:flagellin [Rhizobium sp. Q54]